MTPYYVTPDVTLYQADVRGGLDVLPAESVHLVLTSPPYWGLRRYSGVPDDIAIGNEKTPQEYVSHLVDVFRRVRRVLREDGVCCINLGDSYMSGGRGSFGPKGSTLNVAIKDAIRAAQPDGVPPKSLLEMPSRVVLAR